jgi:hypothetical protein
MKQRKLGIVKPDRVCCCCGRAEKHGAKDMRRMNVLAISPLIYRRGEGKAILKNAGKIQVCEECFIRAMLPNPSDEHIKLSRAISERIRTCYSSIIEGDA